MAEAGAPAARGSDRGVRVLLVIGDRPLANTIDLTLQHGHYLRRVVERVTAAKAVIAEWGPHLLVVDIDTETGGGLLHTDEAQSASTIVVIKSTRLSDRRQKLDAFELGAHAD